MVIFLYIITSDDNLAGMGGGKFLERLRVKKPNQQRYGTEMSTYYQASDMFVGNTVELNSFEFMIIDADEYAFRYMEEHASEVRFVSAATASFLEFKLESRLLPILL